MLILCQRTWNPKKRNGKSFSRSFFAIFFSFCQDHICIACKLSIEFDWTNTSSSENYNLRNKTVPNLSYIKRISQLYSSFKNANQWAWFVNLAFLDLCGFWILSFSSPASWSSAVDWTGSPNLDSLSELHLLNSSLDNILAGIRSLLSAPWTIHLLSLPSSIWKSDFVIG